MLANLVYACIPLPRPVYGGREGEARIYLKYSPLGAKIVLLSWEMVERFLINNVVLKCI